MRNIEVVGEGGGCTEVEVCAIFAASDSVVSSLLRSSSDLTLSYDQRPWPG